MYAIIVHSNVSLCLDHSLSNPPIPVDTPYETVLAEIEDTHSLRNKVVESLANLWKSQLQPETAECVVEKGAPMLELRLSFW